MSRTLSAKTEWNFSEWQRSRPKIDYTIDKSEDWAEIIGVALGDGFLFKFPRTERLRIACNSKERNQAEHIASLIEKVFRKRPQLSKRKSENCIDVTLYQCHLSKRLHMPAGNKMVNQVRIPKAIRNKKSLLIRCLKGIFETDGNFTYDRKNYTRVIELKNFSQPLLKDVYSALKNLRYHPQLGRTYVRLARKDEAYDFINLIQFKKY